MTNPADIARALSEYWMPIETADRNEKVPVLVEFNHDADPYYDPADPNRLTDYAANAEGGDYLAGAGERKARLSPAALARLLRYEPGTGTFTWRPRERGDDIQYMKFNKSVAGRPAFTRKNAHRYLIEKMFGLTYAAGRVAWCLHYGRWPDNFIDHINGDPTDNRIDNLRDVEASENARNCAMPVNNTSGIVGVSRARSGKWIARILYNRRHHHLGTFASKEEAAAARTSAERRLGFHPNHGRVRHAK